MTNNNLNKEFRKLFLDISEAEYRKLPYVSYSALSQFDKKGPISIVQKIEDPEDILAFAFGSLVDETLLEQDNNFEDKFHRFNGEAPTASLLELSKALLKLDRLITPDDTETVLEVIKQQKLWSKMVDVDKLIKKFNNNNFWAFLEAKHVESKGKFLIDNAIWAKAMTTANTLREHPYTSSYFTDVNQSNSFTQLKGQVELYGRQFKFMTDLVLVDHDARKIYPKDLKTGSKLAEKFQKSFYDWRYWIQGGLYRKAIIEIIKNSQFSDYTVEPFEFIYIHSHGENAPIKYVMPIELETKFSDKWVDVFGNTRDGYPQLFEKYHWHKLNQEYTYSKETVDNNGFKILE